MLPSTRLLRHPNRRAPPIFHNGGYTFELACPGGCIDRRPERLSCRNGKHDELTVLVELEILILQLI
jgi:hypothetical protein